MDSAQGHMPLSPPQRAATLRSFYRFHARIYDQTRWAFLFGRRAAVAALNLKPGHSVLEIGCGTGLNFPLLVAAVGPAGRVLGLDASPAMLRRAERRIARRGWNNVSLHLAEAVPLRLEDRFDAVLFSYSLSMIREWERALSEAAGLLRPGATLGVLDFGDFESWPAPVASTIRSWLGLHQVGTGRPIETRLHDLLDNAHCERKLGGYYFVATGRGGPAGRSETSTRAVAGPVGRLTTHLARGGIRWKRAGIGPEAPPAAGGSIFLLQTTGAND